MGRTVTKLFRFETRCSMPIQVLPQTLINQIAAGEVVVRMASVAKELVENSIDANSKRIEVSVKNEARDLEIRDDGIGMNRDDAELCLQRHATSKIRTSEDLFNLMTRGFRGEALPSIASVSRLEIQTREHDANAGTRVVVEGGRIERIEPVGCPPGTRIVVRDLFYNTPARRKFLKTNTSETNAIMTTITRQAIAQPSIGFRVERDGREALDLPSGQTLADRFRSILGSQLKGELLPLDFVREGVRISGILAHPHDARGNRTAQYFYINGRPFSSKPISASLEQACRGFVMVGKFPICCVFIDIDPEQVDFNVHPTKEEVRFRNERMIAGAVYRAAQEALEGSSSLVGAVTLPEQESTSEQPTPTAAPPPPPGFFNSPDQMIRRVFERKQSPSGSQRDWIVDRDRSAPPATPEGPRIYTPGKLNVARGGDGHTISAGPGERPDRQFWERGYDPEPLGQIADTYIIVRFGPDMLIVDQHAAHERLVYLALKKRQTRPDTQQLLVPITMELEPAQSEILRDLLDGMADLGFEISEFGPRTWAVNSLPADLPEFDPVPMIVELLGDMEQAKKVNALEEIRDRILIRTACHSAIRAGMQLPMDKMQELVSQVKSERLSFTCPHGRPTIVRLTKDELDRQFKRIV